MKFCLKYGNTKISFDVERERVLAVVNVKEDPGIADPTLEVYKALQNPIGSSSLRQIAAGKKPKKVAIIVNDITRPTPFHVILPPILTELQNAGIRKEQIKFFIATGIHDPNTREQNIQTFGEKLLDTYEFVSHNPDRNLVNLGKLSTGNELYINKDVYESDLIITTGIITPHYLAQYSGGRKSILPGVAGRSTIERNHQAMLQLVDDELDDNRISLEMIEAAKRVGVDFIVNVVPNSNKEIIQVVAGDLIKAWREGTKTCSRIYRQAVPAMSDLTIASAGGYPKDINIYQAQKALENAARVTREGGIIILLAECAGGFGEKVFEQWLCEAAKPKDIIDRIQRKFVIGGHKAFAIAKVAMTKEIILVSSLSKKETNALFCRKEDTMEEALAYAESKLVKDHKIIIMPEAGLVKAYVKGPGSPKPARLY